MPAINLALIPGVLGFHQFGPVAYFNGVAEHLRATFPILRVVGMSTDPLATVARRAELLAAQLLAAFGPNEPLHLIAHSMGGLDARYLVAKDLGGMGARVRTIVTLGTPHFGSPVTDLLHQANWMKLLPTLLPDQLRFLDQLRTRLNAVHDLTTAGATALTTDCPDRPGVTYHVVAGTGRPGRVPTAALMLPTYLYVKSVAGPNDGVVPLPSALGARPAFALWPADHEDMIGRDLNGPTPLSRPSFPYLPAYDDLITRAILPQTGEA